MGSDICPGAGTGLSTLNAKRRVVGRPSGLPGPLPIRGELADLRSWLSDSDPRGYPAVMSTQEHGSIGSRFVEAIAAKDRAGLADLLNHHVAFRGLTPSDAWEAQDPDGVIAILLGSWFEPADHVKEILDVRTDPVAGRTQLRYRLRVESGGDSYLVDQQGYYDIVDGRIMRMSLVCAGFQPWPE